MVAVGSKKHKAIAQKQDISEEHRNFRVVNLKVKNLNLPDVFLSIMRVRKGVQHRSGCG
jgi:hypothetical protein